MYPERRARLLDAMGAGVAIFASSPVYLRNNDTEHEHRQDSDLFYLTGFDEPESVLIVSNCHPKHRAVMFVRPRHPERETWDGPREGIAGVAERPGIDAAYDIAELPGKLVEYLSDTPRVHYRLGVHDELDALLVSMLGRVRRLARTGVRVPNELVDPSVTVHELRLRKEPAEIATMREAARITADAHARAMDVARPDRFEHEVEAEIIRTFRAHGSARVAYGSIVGSGINATILHYRKNDRQMKDGELLLIDAGCELGYYASDVTRTFPISGKFTEAQRQIYEVVLKAQVACIESVKPGITLETIHATAIRELTRGLIDLGIIEGPLDGAIQAGSYRPYYMHRTSHWLGMDVHDVGAYFIDGQARPLEPGFVLTIEPGLYFGSMTPAPERYQGIGVRIEDDILVTERGYENLTAAIPKTVADIEAALAKRS